LRLPAGDNFDAHLASRWVGQREQLGGAIPNMFMRVTSRVTDGLPAGTWLGDGLVRASFIHTPYRQPHPRTLSIGLLDQAFFCARVRVVDLDLATFALADDRPCVAPGPIALPTDAGIVQDGPDRVRADVRQAIRCAS
jgi:hypothetical protein